MTGRLVPVDVRFVIDPASAWTVLAAGDFDPALQLPGDDAGPVVDVFGVQQGLPVRALLSAETADTEATGVRHLELAELFVVASPAGTSRLGRDLLRRWLMVYDPRDGNLLFQPYDNDRQHPGVPDRASLPPPNRPRLSRPLRFLLSSPGRRHGLSVPLPLPRLPAYVCVQIHNPRAQPRALGIPLELGPPMSRRAPSQQRELALCVFMSRPTGSHGS